MALSGTWVTPVEHVDGELLTAAKVNAWQNNLLHLASRPKSSSNSGQAGESTTSTTYAIIAGTSVVVTPKVTGYLMAFGSCALAHTVANGQCLVGFNINGTNTPYVTLFVPTGNTVRCEFFALIAVTANTTYTLQVVFNNNQGSGTASAPSGATARAMAIEAGA